MEESVATVRRATIKVSFQAYRLGLLVNSTAIPTMVPTFINTSIPTLNISISDDQRRLQNSEVKLYEEETIENRQLQTNSSSLQICLIKYQVKIVQVVQQITVPLPYNVTPSDYVLILENLLSNQEYVKSVNDLALYYGVPVYLNVSTIVCGYVTLKSEPSQLPTFVPSTDPSILSTITPSIAPAVAPTFIPSSALPPTFTPSLSPTDALTSSPTTAPTPLGTTEPSIVPTAEPTAFPTDVPSASPSTVTPSSSVPSTVTPSSSVPSTVVPSIAAIGE